MSPWHLTLGALDELQLSIALEPDDRLALRLDSSGGWPEPPYLRIAMVQPGRQIELHPLHGAQSLPLPRPMASLDDLWLLVRTATRRHWFEIPYGVCGAPGAATGPAQAGPPRPPPGAMVDDAVIPWRAIRFALGRSADCQLDLVATSTRPGELDLEARRHEPGPPPELEVTSSGGAPRLLDPWRALTPGPDQLHVCRYMLAYDTEARSARTYVELQIRGASSFELVLPSSLTDPAHRSAAGRRPARFT